MISVITYGRNDNYGFNLTKRTAFGFNCLAEVLTEEDEILFVDYNTPDHLPTLPEFIWDTLTDRALNLIKVIRISHDLHERMKGDSPLPVLENVSRNVAVVRSNPKNHWILSTNPDVILVLASRWPNLAELLRNTPDSFYEMPRFDIPESVWSALPRDEPRINIGVLRDWLVSHGAAVVETVPDWRFQKFLLFDAPGDFQLAPRANFLRLRGFDESMNKYLHSDSNLAKRMWLLNGQQTHHLLGDLWVLHQDHYLSGEWARNVSTINHNDYISKVLQQEEIEANDESWGLRGVHLPIFCLSDRIKRERMYFSQLPTTTNGNLPLSRELDWRLQPFYRLCNYQPEVLTLYLRELLRVVPAESLVFYLGQNPATFEHCGRAWDEVSPAGVPLQDLAEAVERGENVAPDVLLVDFFYERSEYWERRIRLLQEQMQRQLEKGRITQQEAEEEVGRFADNSDMDVLESRLVPLWKKILKSVQLRPGACVILMGSNLYTNPFFRFQEAFATCCVGVKMEPTWLQRLHSYYQKLKLRMHPEGEHNPLLKLLWGIRLLKRRVFHKLTGHGSLMGLIYLHHTMRVRKQITRPLNLRALYVHHRLVVMRVEP